MAYERVQKTFGQSSSKKKHTPIVPPLNEEPTQAGSQLSPLVKPSRIPSSEKRDAIKRKIFDSISRSGENQAMREGLFSPTVRVQNTPDFANTIGMPIQAKLTDGDRAPTSPVPALLQRDPIEEAVMDPNLDKVKADVNEAMKKIQQLVVTNEAKYKKVLSVQGRDAQVYAPIMSFFNNMLELIKKWDDKWSIEDTSGTTPRYGIGDEEVRYGRRKSPWNYE